MTEVLSPVPPTEAMDKLAIDNNAASANASPAPESHDTVREPLTVFHDPKNFTVKHPLMHKWTLWFTKTPTATGPKESWADLLKEVITFDSVEEFWGYRCLSHPRYRFFGGFFFSCWFVLAGSLTCVESSTTSPKLLKFLSSRIMLFSRKECVLNGKTPPIKKAGNGVINSNETRESTNCGFTL